MDNFVVMVFEGYMVDLLVEACPQYKSILPTVHTASASADVYCQ